MSMRATGARAGMTIIEATVWIMVFVFATLAVVSSVQYFYKTNTYAVEQSSAVSSAERGVKQMVRTIREAAYSANGAYPIVSLAEHVFIFYADTNSDDRAERLRYFIEGTSLKRGIIAPSADLENPYTGTETISVLSDNARNIEQNIDTFTYYDENGDELASYADIVDLRFVSISVVVNVNPARLPNQLILQSSAALRNLK